MSITIDQKASDKLKSLLQEKSIETDTLRVILAGMGCSGPMFNLAKDDAQEGDLVVEFDGMKYAVEKKLVDEFEGFQILHYEQDGMTGVYVQPVKVMEAGGCSSCSGCH